jgi:hypothetical protein
MICCKKCGSLDLIEKKNPNKAHKIGVYCADCESWVKWGTIEAKTLIPEGFHKAHIVNASEKERRDGGKYITIFVSVQHRKIMHFLYQNNFTQKYNRQQLSEILSSVNLDIITFFDIATIIYAIQGKIVNVKIKHVEAKGKTVEKIEKWGAYMDE